MRNRRNKCICFTRVLAGMGVKRFIYFLLIMVILVSFAGCNHALPLLAGSEKDAVAAKPTDTQNEGDASPNVTNPPTKPENPESPTIIPAGTDPSETKPKPIIPPETEPPATEPEVTEPPETQPPATEPEETEPPETQPPAAEPEVTDPPETEPVHKHAYSVKSTVLPTCEAAGYTIYVCSCGDSYKDDEVAAIGHSWGEWKVVADPTTEREGQEKRICSECGASEMQSIEKLPAEVIDVAVLEEYGRQYGADTYGYEISVGVRAGYFPAYYCIITSLEDGYREVEECIDDTTNALLAAGYQIYQEFEGDIGRIRLDIEVVHERDNIYYVWVYYG